MWHGAAYETFAETLKRKHINKKVSKKNFYMFKNKVSTIQGFCLVLHLAKDSIADSFLVVFWRCRLNRKGFRDWGVALNVNNHLQPS